MFVLNNNGYGIIKQFQSLYLGKRYEASGVKKGGNQSDFKKIAGAFDLDYFEIKNHNNLKKLSKIINSNRPSFINVIIKNDQKIIPKLEFGRPIEDLSPLLNDKIFNSEMMVKSLRKIKIKKAFVNEIN